MLLGQSLTLDFRRESWFDAGFAANQEVALTINRIMPAAWTLRALEANDSETNAELAAITHFLNLQFFIVS